MKYVEIFYVRGIIQVPWDINGSDDDILRLGLLNFWNLMYIGPCIIVLVEEQKTKLLSY